MKGGVQSVMANIMQIMAPIPDLTNRTFVSNISSDMLNFWMQLESIVNATRQLFLTASTLETNYSIAPGSLEDSWPAGHPSFLEVHWQEVGSDDSGTQFIWGDVMKGIEETSHNVTAALLTLQLGMMWSNCSFDQLEVVVYQYTSFVLWVPYGVSNFSLLSH
jgi:hypothetical protein